MEKLILEEKLKAGATLKQIAVDVDSSQTTVRYYLKKFGLKPRRGRGGKLPKDLQTPRKCACGETDPNKFYGHKVSICAICHNKYNHDEGKKKREYIINKLGGKCKHCGYKKYKSGFDVHHLDPNKKDVSFASHRSWSYSRIDKELEHCVLLCSCCHNAYHSGELTKEEIEKLSIGY